MMDVRTYTRNQTAKQFIHSISHHSLPCEMGLNQDLTQQQGDILSGWHKDPSMSCANECIRNNVAKNSMSTAKSRWRQWKSDWKSLLSVDGASKEFMNQKMLPCQLENMLPNELCDASISKQEVACYPRSSFGNSSSAQPLVALPTVVSNSSLRTSNAPKASCFDHVSLGSSMGSSCDGYNQGVLNSLTSDGGSLRSSKCISQVASETVSSPEQISSISACSDADVNFDTGIMDAGRTFSGGRFQHLSGSSSENCVQQKHFNEDRLNMINSRGFLDDNQNACNVGFPSVPRKKLEIPVPNLENMQQDPWTVPEAYSILPSVISNTPLSTCEVLLEPEMLPGSTGSQKFHQGHQQPSMLFEERFVAQSQYHFFEQDGCFRRVSGELVAKASHLPLEQSAAVQHLASEGSLSSSGPNGAANFIHYSDVNPQRILLSYMNYKRIHAEGSQVSFVDQMHSTVCGDCLCNCDKYSKLVSHFDNCHDWGCKICRPARMCCVMGKPPQGSRKQERDNLRAFCDKRFSSTSYDQSEDFPHQTKRMKTAKSVSNEIGVSSVVTCSIAQTCDPGESEELPQLRQWPETPVLNDLDPTKDQDHFEVSTPLEESRSASSSNGVSETLQKSIKSALSFSENLVGCSKEEGSMLVCTSDVKNNMVDTSQILSSHNMSVPSEEFVADQKEKRQVCTKPDQAKLEMKSNLIAPAVDAGRKLGEPKILGVSLIDFFTVEEVKDHLSSLRQWISEEAFENTITNAVGENTCQLCAMDKLLFAPAPIYCSSCGIRIKRNLIYYCTLDEMGTRYCFCTSCFKGSRGCAISFHGISIAKSKLHKERNIHEDGESWVQCDQCKNWQHQICALYNDKRDLGGKAEYICPKCYVKGVEVGELVPLQKTVAFGAKDLSTTLLSDYIEQRLSRRLKQEREERANALHKNLHEVPGAKDLTVRVVMSVNKLLKVKQQFLDIFHDENYPTEFPYRSKVILLFQKIEGVDVCLFGMYVQEFGSECGQPNQRCVYVSYLDSAKYFRPDIKTTSGEALRTFVYHEILIGYLDYCKKRGFATCYIWACPPLKGEDYILYCHPESQKTPKPDKLRHWYKSMLRKAAEENIVADCTNLYDHYFLPAGKQNIKISAARLPYFDGDYWSGAAVDMIRNIEQGSQIGSEKKVKKVLTKRTLKAMGHTDLSDDAAKDILVMQKLGQTIFPVKEDFLMVRLQYTCTRCHEVILSGSRWVCLECRNFQLCVRCCDLEQNLGEENVHTSSSGQRHNISQVTVNDVTVDTDDKDVVLDNSYFENRHSFLSFCQVNHYQFDSLRRAKHSSMMILYHLHNLSEPTLGTTCYICHRDIVANQGWHCEICPGFNACDGCYQRKGSDCHNHKLSQRLSVVNWGSKKGRSQQQKHNRVRELLNLLMHASQCNAIKSSCSYPNCLQIRRLFHHARQCNLRLAGGCQLCQKTWMLLRLHSKNCRDSNCRVPRCMDLKKHAELLVQQSETRRRAALGSLRGF
ncbi:Histone acetyltransferase [Bertholletia excelsa]